MATRTRPMLDDLARSGLDHHDARKLKMRMLSPTDARKAVGHSVRGYLIPYFDTQGKPLDFARLRSVEDEGPKYRQKKGTRGSHLYLAPFMDWTEIEHSTVTPIIIVEGEKKAAAGCKAGFATIGIGGVYNLGDEEAKNLFNMWALNKRTVFIAFDSDMRTNPQVAEAAGRLANWLTAHGADVFDATLPMGKDSDKVGLDDFLVDGGDFAHHLKCAVPIESSPLMGEKAKHLAPIMRRFWILTKPSGAFYDVEHLQTWREPQLRTYLKQYCYWVAKDNGTLSERNPFEDFIRMRGPYRNEAIGVDLHPSKPRIFRQGGETWINSWSGFEVEPSKGSIQPWIDVLGHVLRDQGAVDYVMDWFAHRVQLPHERMNHMLLIWSPRRGTGKSSIATPVLRAVGERHSTIIEPGEMFGQFTARWQLGKILTVVEELHMQSEKANRGIQAHLKTLITNNSVRIEEKNQPAYNTKNYNAFFCTSNYEDAIKIEDASERRYWVWKSTEETLPEKLTNHFHGDWMNGPGPSAVLHHLLHRKLQPTFTASGPCPKTQAFYDMLEESESDLSMTVRDFVQNSQLLGSDIFTATEMAKAISIEYPRTSFTPNNVGRVLRSIAVRRQIGGKDVQGYYYAVRNLDKWTEASSKEWADEIRRSKSAL